MKELTLFAYFLTIKETGPYSHTSSMGSNVVRCHDSLPRPVPKLGPFEIDRKDREACPNRRGQAGRDEDRGHRLDNLAREFRTQRIIFETARERLRPNAGELASAGRK